MNITAYMPLWSRPRHTLRWMWHLNRIKFPFPILFGDGGDQPELRKILTERSDLFPNLNYQYFQYESTGNDLSDFTNRCADMLSKIETPYVIWCDNDDFPCVSGIQAAEKQLDQDSELTTAGGPNGMIALYEGPSIEDHELVTGEPYRYHLQHKAASLTETSALDRVCQYLVCHRSLWHRLQRTENLVTAFKRTANINWKNPRVIEDFMNVQPLIDGKSLTDPSYTHIFRQNALSIIAFNGVDNRNEPQVDNIKHDEKIMIEKVSELIAIKDGLELENVMLKIENVFPYANKNKHKIKKRTIILSVEAVIRNSARLLLRLKPLRDFRLKLERTKMFREFEDHGASQILLSAMDKELREIEATLSDGSFNQFLRDNKFLGYK